MKGDLRFTVATVVACVVIVALCLLPFRLPAPKPQTAPLSEFSAVRATQHIPVISREPHPAGSPAQAAVRDYIVGQLRSQGLAPEVQTATVPVAGGSLALENVLARIPGTAPTGALVILAHYDSVPEAPGAWDNGGGVASLLEVARALATGPAPRNDIILLFDDGEEYGYLGTYAFVAQHPWMADVRAAVGLDQAGIAPIALLAAGPDNGPMLAQLGAAYHQPLAYRFFLTLVEDVTNDSSEVTPFHQAGVPGLEMEDIYANPARHTAQDRGGPANLASLQHMGEQTLALARRLGNADLGRVGGANATYFTLAGLGLVNYPSAWDRPLALVVALLLAVTVALGLRRRYLSWQGLLGGLLTTLAALGLSPVLVYLLWRVIPSLHEGLGGPFPGPHPPHSGLYFLGLLACVLAVAATMLRVASRQVSLPNLALGGLLLWLVFSLAAAAALPGLAYAFSWPLLTGALGWGTLFLARRVGQPWGRWLALMLTFAAGALLLVPNILLTYLATAFELEALLLNTVLSALLAVAAVLPAWAVRAGGRIDAKP